MSKPGSRSRDRWFAWLTVGVALFWVIAAYRVSAQVAEVNTARLFGGLMVGGGLPETDTPPRPTVIGPGSRPALPSLGLFSAIMSQPASGSPASAEAHAARVRAEALKRATFVVEVGTTIWRRMMYVVAGLFAALALIARTTSWARAAHLLTALLVLGSTVATLAAMAILSHPTGGALPPLPTRTYAMVGALLSAYGILLIAAFARRRRSRTEMEWE